MIFIMMRGSLWSCKGGHVDTAFNHNPGQKPWDVQINAERPTQFARILPMGGITERVSQNIQVEASCLMASL